MDEYYFQRMLEDRLKQARATQGVYEAWKKTETDGNHVDGDEGADGDDQRRGKKGKGGEGKRGGGRGGKVGGGGCINHVPGARYCDPNASTLHTLPVHSPSKHRPGHQPTLSQGHGKGRGTRTARKKLAFATYTTSSGTHASTSMALPTSTYPVCVHDLPEAERLKQLEQRFLGHIRCISFEQCMLVFKWSRRTSRLTRGGIDDNLSSVGKQK